ncbi:MAG TPA: peptidoglycan-binding protein [Chthoniobacteraceae bacterium]|jgi:His-Xaa-Ser repeat protein HxsA
MKAFKLFRILPLAILLLVVAAPTNSWADRRSVTVYRDRDGDGHYNKKRIEVGNRHHSRRGYYGSPYRSYSYHRPYSYYQPYPYYSYGPSVSLSYSRPIYSTRTRYYSSSSSRSSYSDELGADVQRELRRRGYYRGSIDGEIGAGTRSAIRAYQDDRGLSVTGRIDRSLLRSLGIG